MRAGCVCVYVCCVYIYIIPITAIYRSCAMSESFFFWLKHFDQISFFPRLWALPVLSSDLKVLGLSLALSVTFFPLFYRFSFFLCFIALLFRPGYDRAASQWAPLYVLNTSSVKVHQCLLSFFHLSLSLFLCLSLSLPDLNRPSVVEFLTVRSRLCRKSDSTERKNWPPHVVSAAAIPPPSSSSSFFLTEHHVLEGGRFTSVGGWLLLYGDFSFL